VKRIKSIDVIRGFAILLMIMAHVCNQWLKPEDIWFHAVYYLVVTPVGVPAFVFVAGLGFGYSWVLKWNTMVDKKEVHFYALSRSLALCVAAFGYTLIATLIHQDPWRELWFWWILTTLAVARLLAQPLMLTSKWVRLAIALGILVFTPFYLSWLQAGRSESSVLEVLYFISFNPLDANSIFIFFPHFLVASIIGEFLYGISESNIVQFGKKLTGIGCGILIIAIIIGWQPTSQEFGWTLIQELQTHPTWNITSLPLLLIINSYAWLTYSFGLIFIGMGLLLTYFEPKPKIWRYNMLTLFGKYSLTIYLTQYVFYLFPFQFSAEHIVLGFLIYGGVYWLFCIAIDRYSGGHFSVEFVLELGAYGINNLFHGKVESIAAVIEALKHKRTK
jgi:hypothetical protein